MFQAQTLRGAHFPTVSFHLQSREILIMHGPSGVGKSQILRALADMIEHEGEILLKGDAPVAVRAIRVAPEGGPIAG